MDSENHAIVYFDKFDLHVFSTIWNLNQSLAKKVNAITGFISSRFVLLCPARREGGSMLCFCPSVCPSRTQRITREPEGLACPNSEWRFPTFDATRTPVSRSKGQRSGSPGPLMLTHPAASSMHNLPRTAGWRSLFIDHFRINLHQTRMQCSNEGPQHCNWAQFLKITF